jgi:hypothetical protein
MAREKKEAKTVDGMPHPEVLKTLASQVGGSQAEMDSARGEIGSFMKNAEDKFGVHRKAFKLAMGLQKADSTKLAEFLRHFDYYRGVFELNRLAGSDMLIDRDATANGAANGNQPDDQPVPATDEQEEDPRSPDLKRRHAEIEAEQAATRDAAQESAEVVAANVTKLRRGIKPKPAPEGEATGTYSRH